MPQQHVHTLSSYDNRRGSQPLSHGSSTSSLQNTSYSYSDSDYTTAPPTLPISTSSSSNAAYTLSDPTPVSANPDPDTPLPSLALSSLSPSAPEVANIFHLPLSALLSPARLRSHRFRGQQGVPYWAVDVTDLVTGNGRVHEKGAEEVVDEVGEGRDGRLEVWGLTGWYMGLLMEALGMLER